MLIKKFIILLLVSFCFNITNAQSPIFFDGRVIEWENTYQIIDDANDGGFYDIVSLNVDNDNHFVYFNIEFENEINLTEDNPIELYIDTDDDATTGLQFAGLGAELIWYFGENEGQFVYNNNWYNIDFADVKMRALPTHTGKNFEVAFGKDVVISGANQPLFPSNSIRVKAVDINSNDFVPNLNISLQYVMDEVTLSNPNLPLQKLNPATVRLMNWNTEFDGILDFNRRESFIEVIQTVQPEIIAFQEVWATTVTNMQDFLTDTFGTNAGWYIAKNEDNNIIVSKYPIIGNYNILSGSRLQAVLIDLPSNLYDDDLLLVNAHFSCCGADDNRQLQANAFAQFILDVKDNSFTGFDVAAGTPFMLVGDLNLVGDFQQLETALTGNIYENGSISGSPLDWNNGELTNLFASQTDLPVAYTWRNDFGSFPPGKLDYIIYSSSVMDIENSYIIQTETMSADKLNQYNLNLEATSTASDHFPIVADLNISTITGIANLNEASFSVYPNPFEDLIFIDGENLENKSVKIYKANGRLVFNGLMNESKLNLNTLDNGIYFMQIESDFIRIVKH